MRKKDDKKKMKLDRDSIGGRFLRVILGAVLFLSLFFTAVNIVTILQMSTRSRQLLEQMTLHVSEQILTPLLEQRDNGTLNMTTGSAESVNRFFEGCLNTTEMIGSVAGRLYREDQPSSKGIVEPPTKDDIGEDVVYRLDDATFDAADPANIHTMEVMSTLRHILRSAYAMDVDIASAYFASEDGFTFFADNRVESVLDENGNPMPFDAKSRAWYQDAVAAGGAVFSPLTTDYFTGEGTITCSVPVYADDRHTDLIGVVAADVRMETVDAILNESLLADSRVCITDGDGNLMIATDTEGLFGLEPDEKKNLYDESRPTLNEILKESASGEKGHYSFSIRPDGTELPEMEYVEGVSTDEDWSAYIEESADSAYYEAYYAPINLLGWSYLFVADGNTLNDQMNSIVNEFYDKVYNHIEQDRMSMVISLCIGIGTFVAVLLIMGALSKRETRRITEPIVALTKKIGAVNGDNLEFEWHMEADNETTSLAESFGVMTERIRTYIRDLTTVTAEKERIGAELDVATKIQSDMLPLNFPDREDFRLYASMRPAKEVGGDFYDFFFVDDDHLALVIADVSGKGVPAALFMVIAKTLIKNSAMNGMTEPKEVFSIVNNILCDGNEEMLFVTAWMGILTLSTGEMVCANAGHEYPIIRRAGGSFERFEDEHDVALAVVEDVQYRQYSVTLAAGDMLYLYTDGFPEAMDEDNEQFTEERLLNALNEESFEDPKALDDLVRQRVDEFTGEASQFDDMTSLVIRYLGK